MRRTVEGGFRREAPTCHPSLRAQEFRRAAAYVDRILKGEKPPELPVQAPIEFQLVVNLKTAKAMGFDVPLHLQQLANEIIE